MKAKELVDELVEGSGQYGWTRKDAEEFMRAHEQVWKRAGYRGQMVGSVATKGRSKKDLDILLTAITPHYDDARLTTYFNGTWHDSSFGESFAAMLPWKDGIRVVEFFFDVPDKIADQIEKFYRYDTKRGRWVRRKSK